MIAEITTATPHLIPSKEVKSFMLAGKAILTFQSTETEKHLTYLIKKHDDKDLWFVRALTSPNNDSDYTFLGTIYKTGQGKVGYKHSAKSRVKDSATSAKTINWVVDRLDRPEVLAKVRVNHEGYCCKCGRLLTTPESVERGIGPVCFKMPNFN